MYMYRNGMKVLKLNSFLDYVNALSKTDGSLMNPRRIEYSAGTINRFVIIGRFYKKKIDRLTGLDCVWLLRSIETHDDTLELD